MKKMTSVLHYLVIYGKVGSYVSLLLVVIGICRCQSESKHEQWEIANIDSAIVSNVIYNQLDKEREVFSVGDDQDTSKKRSSGVAYFTKGHVNLSDSNSARLNNCRAYFSEDGKLNVNIGIGNGFGGWGFIIHYKDTKFYTEPYYSTDLVIPDESDPTYEVVYQKLTLDKPAYVLGDSLYGRIDFKSIETDHERSRIDHTAKGYFRTIVSELY